MINKLLHIACPALEPGEIIITNVLPLDALEQHSHCTYKMGVQGRLPCFLSFFKLIFIGVPLIYNMLFSDV